MILNLKRFLKNKTRSLFVNCPSFWIYGIWICMFLHCQISSKHFGWEHSVGNFKPFLACHIRRQYLMSISLITDDRDFETVSSRFLHTMGTISFCNQWILGEILWDSLDILIPNKISPHGFRDHWLLSESVVAIMVIR